MTIKDSTNNRYYLKLPKHHKHLAISKLQQGSVPTLWEKEGIKGSNKVAKRCTRPIEVFTTMAHAAGSSL